MNGATRDLMLSGCVQNKEALATLLKSFSTPDGAVTLMLLEKLPPSVVSPAQRQALLIFNEANNEVDMTEYTSGRLFHIYGELRWERQKDAIRVVYTGDRACMPAINKEKEEALSAYQPVTRTYFLLGKKFDRPDLGAQPGDFAEVRIPRLLHYPTPRKLADEPYLKLAICEYLDPATGVNRAYRFTELVSGQSANTGGA